MAENKEIAFDLEVKGVEQSITSVKELKNAIKAAKDEQVKAAEQFGVASKEFTNASKAVADLKDKVDDLNDSTKSLKGSGVESVGESFNQLGDGLKNLDLDKVKTGFAGIGKAMSAVPLILLVQGVQYLVEKFEIFKIIGEAVEKLFYALTDAIGLTNKAAEEQSKNLIAGMKEQEIAVQNRYDAEIKLAKAAGKATQDLEIEKLTAVEASAFSQLNILKNLAEQKGKLNDEEKTEYNLLQVALLKATTDKNAAVIADEKAKNDELRKVNQDFAKSTLTISEQLRKSRLSEREREIEAVKEAAAIELKSLDDVSAKAVDNEFEYKRMKQAEVDLAQLTASRIAAINSKYYVEENAKHKASLEEKNRIALENEASLNAALKSLNEVVKGEKLVAEENDAALTFTRKEFTENELNDMKRKKFMDNEMEMSNYSLNLAKITGDSMQALSDAFFAVKNRNLQKGTAAERKAAEQQFKINKALAIQSAIISGIQGVINALSAQSVIPEPFGTILKVASAVGIGIAAAANVAKIASTKFDAGGGGGSTASASLPSAPPIPAPPSISTQQNNTNQSTSFDETGKKIGGDSEKNMQPVIQVKATVGVDEVSKKQDRVETLEKQSTF
jgi:hypothetical protein